MGPTGRALMRVGSTGGLHPPDPMRCSPDGGSAALRRASRWMGMLQPVEYRGIGYQIWYQILIQQRISFELKTNIVFTTDIHRIVSEVYFRASLIGSNLFNQGHEIHKVGLTGPYLI